MCLTVYVRVCLYIIFSRISLTTGQILTEGVSNDASCRSSYRGIK